MNLDFRMYIKTRNPEALTEQLSKLNVQGIDGVRYSFTELIGHYKEDGSGPEVKLFKHVEADEQGYTLCDRGKALDYYISLLGYIWGNLIKNIPDDVLMIADIEDKSAVELGDIVFYYLGGGEGQIQKFRLPASEGGTQLHNDLPITDFRGILETKVSEMNDIQKANLETL